MTRATRASLALCTALALAALPASAQSPADVAAARELFKEGTKLSQSGKWVEARERFERSLKLKRAAITFYSLGVAQKNTDQLVEALESFRAFLAEPSAPATQPYEDPARKAVAELEKRVARLALVVTPAGLTDLAVTIDGQDVPLAALDRQRLVNPGKHVIIATARRHADARAEATVAEGGSAKVVLDLPVRAEPATPGPVASAPSAPASAPSAPPPAPDAPRSRTVPLVLIAGGTAVFAGGTVLGLVGVSNATDAPTRDGPEADSAKTKAIVGDVLAGVGIVAVGAGVFLLVTRGSHPAKTGRDVRVGPWISGSAAGAFVRVE